MAFAQSILSSITSTFFTDVMAVYTQDYTQVFQKARPLKASIKIDSKLMEHPIETGATTTDHRIILPVEIELPLLLPNNTYRESYQEILQLFNNATLLLVQTRTTLYSNQLIQALPYEETPEMFDAVTLILRLKQVQFSSAQFSDFTPSNPNKSSTKDKGNIQPKEVPKNKDSAISDLTGWGS